MANIIGKFVNAITSSIPYKACKFVASATIGIPLSAALSVFILTALSGVAVANAAAAHTLPMFGRKYSGQVQHNPTLKKVVDSLNSAFVSVWRDFGVYAHLKTLEYIDTKTGGYLAKTGRLPKFHEKLHDEYNKDERNDLRVKTDPLTQKIYQDEEGQGLIEKTYGKSTFAEPEEEINPPRGSIYVKSTNPLSNKDPKFRTN